MSQIIVDTDELKADSGTMQKGSKNTNTTSSMLINEIRRIDPNAYDGQLAEQLAPICSDTEHKSTKVISFFDNLSKELDTRANAFNRANSLSQIIAIPSSPTTTNSPVVDIFGKIRQIGVDIAKTIWNLGGITANPGGPGSGQFSFAVIPIMGSAILGAKGIHKAYEDLKTIAKGIFIMFKVSAVDGKLIFFGSHKVKDFFSLNPFLTIENPSTFIANLAKDANPVINGALKWGGAITVITAVVGMAINFVDDIQKYVTPTELISAFVYDTVKIVGNIMITKLIQGVIAGAFLTGATVSAPVTALALFAIIEAPLVVNFVTDHLSDITPTQLIKELLHVNPWLWKDLDSEQADKVCSDIAALFFGSENTEISLKDLAVKDLSGLLNKGLSAIGDLVKTIISAVKNTASHQAVY